MSVLFSDNLNEEWKVYTENLLRNSISLEKSKQYLALLKGAFLREISMNNLQYKAEINDLKIKLAEYKTSRVDMVQFANELLGGIK